MKEEASETYRQTDRQTEIHSLNYVAINVVKLCWNCSFFCFDIIRGWMAEWLASLNSTREIADSNSSGANVAGSPVTKFVNYVFVAFTDHVLKYACVCCFCLYN